MRNKSPNEMDKHLVLDRFNKLNSNAMKENN